MSPQMIYAAGEGIAAWLGLNSWMDVVVMQNPENVEPMRKLLVEAK